MKKKITLCFDIDNVICITKNNDYQKSTPNNKAIKKINRLYNNGHEIKIFTGRFMGRNNDNIKKAKRQGYKMTKKQLKKWKVKYHKLIFGKPSYDLFIDDRSLYYKSNWHKYINKYI